MKKAVLLIMTFIMLLAMAPISAKAITNTHLLTGSGAIRSMTMCGDGSIVGGRSSGHEIEVWSSKNNGSSWTRIGTVASNNQIDYGDVMFLAVPSTNIVYCAFRERNPEGQFAVVVCRSDDGGYNWVYDSTVIAGCSQFVGAPWLFIAQNGDMQCYYDSEPLATQNGVGGSQWIAMQGRDGRSGDWNKYGVVAASRDVNASKFVRDGMATVVDLGNNRIMLVTEGIEDNPSGGAYSNVVRAIQSFDGGLTWDYAGRQIVYQSRIDSASGKRYNAYCPMAIRVGGGPVGVVFCTDEDFGGTPDMSSEDVLKRRTHIKYIRTLDNFETWGDINDIWKDGSDAYAPGMVETKSNEVLISIDLFFGRQEFIKMDAVDKVVEKVIIENVKPEFYGDYMYVTAECNNIGGVGDAYLKLQGYNRRGELIQDAYNIIDWKSQNDEFLFELEKDVKAVELIVSYDNEAVTIGRYDRPQSSSAKDIKISTSVEKEETSYVEISAVVDLSDFGERLADVFEPYSFYMYYRPVDDVYGEWEAISFDEKKETNNGKVNYKFCPAKLTSGNKYDAKLVYSASNIEKLGKEFEFDFYTKDEGINGTYEDVFPDEGLRNIILSQIPGKTEKSNVHAYDLMSINKIQSKATNTIRSLKGIELLKSLTYVEIQNNQLARVDTIDWSQFVNLEYLNLENDALRKFPDLTGCKTLKNAVFANNKFTNIECYRAKELVPEGCNIYVNNQEPDEMDEDLVWLLGYDAMVYTDIDFGFYCLIDSILVKDGTLKAIVEIGDDVYAYSRDDIQKMLVEESQGVYRLHCPMGIAQLKEKATLTILYGEEEVVKEEYSFEEYANEIMNSEDEASKELVKSLLNYGGYAQTYFEYNNLENDKLSNYDLYTAGTDPVLNMNTAQVIKIIEDKYLDLELMEEGTNLKGSFAKYYGSSLVCRDKLGFNVYFTVDGNIDESKLNVRVSHNGDINVKTSSCGNRVYKISIENISILDLASEYTINITYDGNTREAMSATYSPMLYIYKAINSENEKLVNLVKSIYVYHEEAMDYSIERGMQKE